MPEPLGMWELIDYNRRQSTALVLAMGVLLIATGAALGYSITFRPQEATLGAVIAFAVFLLLTLVAFASGDKAVLSLAGAREVTHAEFPQLWNVTEEMSIAAGLPMPKLYVIETDALNAFATGRRPERGVIAVTRGLLNKLSRDELQGVVAHEMSHIRHRDTTYMTICAIMLGVIIIFSEMTRRVFWYGGRMRGGARGRGGRGGGGAVVIFALLSMLLAAFAWFIARVLYFAISRRREYLADAGAVELTRYPDGLASALEKIAFSPTRLENASNAIAHLFIVNPLNPVQEAYSHWNSTHPPVTERIAILRSVAGAASFAAYNSAFQKVTRLGGQYLVRSSAQTLSGKGPQAIRSPSEMAKELERKAEEARKKQFAQMVAAAMLLNCTHCGKRIEVPQENLRDQAIRCSACGQMVPLAHIGALSALAGSTAPATNAQARPKAPPPSGIPRLEARALLGDDASPQPEPPAQQGQPASEHPQQPKTPPPNPSRTTRFDEKR